MALRLGFGFKFKHHARQLYGEQKAATGLMICPRLSRLHLADPLRGGPNHLPINRILQLPGPQMGKTELSSLGGLTSELGLGNITSIGPSKPSRAVSP